MNACGPENGTVMTYRDRKKRTRNQTCHTCGKTVSFCWQCRHCGFSMCQECMYENIWGLSCNHITWTCPECQGHNGLGNQ